MGSGGVGKTALCQHFVDGSIVTEYEPTIEGSLTKQLVVDSIPVVLVRVLGPVASVAVWWAWLPVRGA